MEHLLVYVTFPNPKTAGHIAQTLVRERLAAAANILGPTRSLYWWRGVMEEADETACILKTTHTAFSALEERLRHLHPYETPCIVAVPIVCGSAPFLRWLEEETRAFRQESSTPVAENERIL